MSTGRCLYRLEPMRCFNVANFYSSQSVELEKSSAKLNTVSSNISSSDKNKAKIVTAVLLERLPIVRPPLTDIEQNYENVSMAIENERSFLNDFELKQIEEKRLASERDEGKNVELLLDTTWEKEENWRKAGITAQNRLHQLQENETDINDERSPLRRSDRRLALVVRQKFDTENYQSPWILPQAYHRKGETLKQTVERCLSELNTEWTTSVLGNAPIASISEKFPARLRERLGIPGVEIFVYRALLNNVSRRTQHNQLNKSLVSDFKWLDREGLVAHFAYNRKYHSLIRRLIFE